MFLSPIHSRNSFSRKTSTTSSSTESTNCDLVATQSNDSSTNLFSLSLSLCMTDKLNQIDEKKSKTTIPLDVPSSLDRSSYSFNGCDSGYSDVWTTISSSSYCQHSDRSSDVSMFTDPSIISSRKLSIDSAILVDSAVNGRCSDGCLQKRIHRNMSTSFENNSSGNDFIGYFNENTISINPSNSSISSESMLRRNSDQCETRSNPEFIKNKHTNFSKERLKLPTHLHCRNPHATARTKATQRRSKIGLAICIRFSDSVEDEMELFCSEHIVLLESMLCRLRAAAEIAYGNHKKFHQVCILCTQHSR